MRSCAMRWARPRLAGSSPRTSRSAPVVVFSKSYCPFCAKAKRALDAVAGAANVDAD